MSKHEVYHAASTRHKQESNTLPFMQQQQLDEA
jgi:hypothetical protein